MGKRESPVERQSNYKHCLKRAYYDNEGTRHGTESFPSILRMQGESTRVIFIYPSKLTQVSITKGLNQ